MNNVHGLVIVNIIGGLGNQMFQYAAGRALAARHGVELAFDTFDFSIARSHNGFELHRVFGIQANIASPTEFRNVLGLRGGDLMRRLQKSERFAWLRSPEWCQELPYQMCTYWPDFEKLSDRTYLNGCWQSLRYFSDIEKDIRTDFSFRLLDSDPVKAFAEKIKNTEGAVSLHIRRGDMLSNPVAHAVHGVCPIDYYVDACEYIKRHCQSPTFFVFSDDPAWCREHLSLPGEIHVVDSNKGCDSYKDMFLMSCCRHHVLANSSFSWWGAWLNPSFEKIVVAPKRWFAIPDIAALDIIPDEWVRL